MSTKLVDNKAGLVTLNGALPGCVPLTSLYARHSTALISIYGTASISYSFEGEKIGGQVSYFMKKKITGIRTGGTRSKTYIRVHMWINTKLRRRTKCAVETTVARCEVVELDWDGRGDVGGI
jgi:hypothetical protein